MTLITRTEKIIHTVHRVVRQLVKILFESGVRLLSERRVEIYVIPHPGPLTELEGAVDLLQRHTELKVELEISVMDYVFRFWA